MLSVAALMSLGWIDALRRGVMNATTGESVAALLTLLVAASSLLFMTFRTEWALRQGRLIGPSSIRALDAARARVSGVLDD